MNPSSGNPGLNKLAATLQGQIHRNQEANSALIFDYGEIQSDYSLLTNTYPIPIPKEDYMVCRQLTLGATGAYLTKTIGNDGTHDHGDSGEHNGHTGGNGAHDHVGEGPHGHTVLIPENMRKLLPGDRVLVAWIQNDATVIDIVLPASIL